MAHHIARPTATAGQEQRARHLRATGRRCCASARCSFRDRHVAKAPCACGSSLVCCRWAEHVPCVLSCCGRARASLQAAFPSLTSGSPAQEP